MILPSTFPGPEKSGGREHDVRFDSESGRWWKYTKPDAAGYTVEWDAEEHPFMISAFPIEYFSRLRLQNLLFADDIRLEGVWRDSDGHWRIVTTQPDVTGQAATLNELAQSFEALGFAKLGWKGIGYEHSLAFRFHGYDVWDIHPANVVLELKTNLPIPFDVIVTPVPKLSIADGAE